MGVVQAGDRAPASCESLTNGQQRQLTRVRALLGDVLTTAQSDIDAM